MKDSIPSEGTKDVKFTFPLIIELEATDPYLKGKPPHLVSNAKCLISP
jgi:hypothetical protein